MDNGTWRTSTYSGSNGGTCVEVADTSGAVLVRDTTNRGGGTLQLPATTWSALLIALK